METDIKSETARDLFEIFQLFHKKIMDPDVDSAAPELCRSHYEVLFVLNDLGKMAMTSIAKALNLSKPYMTALTDRLIDVGLAARIPDRRDRRVIHIELTEAGRVFIQDHRSYIKNHIKMKMACLGEDELQELSLLARRIKKIISKIDSI